MSHNPILENKSTSAPPQQFEMNCIQIMLTPGAVCQLTKQNIPESRPTYTVRKQFHSAVTIEEN